MKVHKILEAVHKEAVYVVANANTPLFSSRRSLVKRAFLRAISAVGLITVLGIVPAAAQTGQMFGELVGKVTDDQGGLLPGVTVTLSGPAVMGTPTAVTSATGQYRFPAVASGTYTLKFELTGFTPLTREGIVVPVRQTITVDVELKIASLQESVTVSGASPTVDVENTKVGARLDHDTLTAVPTSRTIFGSTTVLPGMVMARQDPGGLNAATSTGMVAHGNGNYNLNYYGVTADTPQNYGSMYYMDYGSAEEISVDTAAMGAEVGGGGGANINVIPKSGGNNLKGEALYSLTGRGYSDAFSASNVTSDLRSQGVTDPSLQKLSDFNANAGGPFIKDRLWWFGSLRNYTTHENIPGFVDAAQHPIDFESNLRNYTTSGKYQINKNNQLSAFWTYNRKFQPHRGAGVSQPFPAGTLHQESPKNLINGNWTSVMGQNTFLEVSSTYFHMHWPSTWSDEFNALPASQQHSATFNVTTGIWIDGPEPTGERFRDAYRQQTNIALTKYIDGFLGGSHQLKTGFENWWGWGSDGYIQFNDTRLRYTSNADGTNLQPSEVWAYNTPLTQRTRMRNFAAFAQDRISYSRFTLNLGLRWSFYDGYLPEQTGGGGRWFPQTTYPQIDAPYNWSTFAPRTGITWKMTEDGKNVAKAAYSRYYEVMYTGEMDAINRNIIISGASAAPPKVFTWFGDKNGNGLVDPGEYNPTPKSVFTPANNSIDPNLKDPKTDEILFSYQREVMNNLAFSASWIQRWFNDKTVDEDIGIPASAYSPAGFPDPGPDNLKGTADDRTLTFYNVSKDYLGKDVFFHTNCGCTQRYKGLELSVTKRMSDRWQMMGSYVWSRLDGDFVLDPTNPNNLVPFVATGRGPIGTSGLTGAENSNDQPHAFKLLGSYQAPWDITIGANYQALSGLPRDRVMNIPLTQGTTSYRVEPRGTYRYDFLNLFSLRGDKSIRLNGQRKIVLIAEVHNVLNVSADQNSVGTRTQSFANQAAFDAAKLTTSYFGRVQEIVAPRILKLGVRFDF